MNLYQARPLLAAMRSQLLRQQVLKRGLSTSQYYRQPSHSNNYNNNVVNLAYTQHDPPTTTNDSAPPMIIMHGLFGSQRNNRTFSKVLAKELSRPVYTIDLRNHGSSPHHPVHTYTAMCQDVENFLSHTVPSLAPTKPVLIGHSMGAKVAMALALRKPSAYSGIVPLDNAPIDAVLKSDFGTYVRAMQEIENHQPPLQKQSDADKILEKYEENLSIRQFLLTNLVKDEHDRKTLRWRIPLSTLAKSLDAMADFPFKGDDTNVRFEGPTLVIRGGESRYVADEALPVFGRFFPRFELVECPGAGHWVVAEAFERCVEGVVEWTRREIDRE